MTKFTSVIAITALSTVAFTSAAFAGESMDKDMKPATVETTVTVAEAPASKVIISSAEAESEVLGAVARGELTAVEGPDGRVYYNRVIPVSQLPDPELDIQVLDTFEVEFEGDVYTNKLVQELG